ncbi:MAG: gephyrin-like molybdotransferase Glp [Ginsengibacter sp.]
MISVDDAKKIIKDNIEVMPSIKVPLEDAVGFVLAQDVFSKIDFPPFNQSNVDGYAIAFEDIHERLTISGESAAGNAESFELQPKQAMRIFTGAPVPAKADTVIMQEKVMVDDKTLLIEDRALQQGSNFRKKGKDIQQGGLALQKDDCLSAGAIGFLTALGLTEVCIYKQPSISIIITGNELQQAGKALQYGQVYEANSKMLQTALGQLLFNDVEILHAADDLNSLTSILSDALHKTDMVLLCGGVSVGDYDFVVEAATDCGVQKLFHKIKQRPGKPLYFGRKNNKVVFGLPGNPSSVLTCFYEYVVEALMPMISKKNVIKSATALLAEDYKKPVDLTVFLKGFLLDDSSVIPLDAQESYRLSSYAKANCLIKLEEGNIDYKKGDMVEIHILPN